MFHKTPHSIFAQQLLDMTTLRSIMSIDPRVAKEIRLFLPSGPNVLGMVPDLRKLKWEYTVVFMCGIEELQEMLSEYPHVVRNAVESKFNMYMHACSYMGIFENFSKMLWASHSTKINMEFLCLMMEALVKDVKLFEDEAPSHLFLCLEQWKIHKTYEMLQEMKMEPMNCYDAVSFLYVAYQENKQKNGGDDKLAMEKLKMSQNQRAGLADSSATIKNTFPMNPIFLNTSLFATLMDRIYKLEARLEALENSTR